VTVMCQCSHNLHEIKERHFADGTSPRQAAVSNVPCDFLRFLQAEEGQHFKLHQKSFISCTFRFFTGVFYMLLVCRLLKTLPA